MEEEYRFNLGRGSGDLIKEVKAIANLDLLERELERNKIALKFDVRKSVIDEYIKKFINKKETETPEIVEKLEPWEGTVDGSILLNSLSMEISTHVILPTGAADAIAAWVLLTYCPNAFRILPILGITSPVKRCGKTTLLEVLQSLVNKGLAASNISPAAVFRTIDKHHPTLLIDEADTFLKDNDELRGVLNSGHTKKTAFVVRINGDTLEPVKFSTWGSKVIAMIGALPETLADRSIIVPLRRKMGEERSKSLSLQFETDCLDLRQKCQRWANDNINELTTARPHVPQTGNDRQTDNWTPLFAIASLVGGGWPEKLEKSMLKMLNVTDDNIGALLLEDIQSIFNSNDRIFSDDLIESLKGKTERPWIDWNRGKGLTPNGLARLLNPFGIKSKNMRINGNLRKGYSLESFKESFSRYLLSQTPPISSVTPLQVNNINRLDANQSVTQDNDVTDEKQPNQLKSKDCYDVTDEIGGIAKDIKESLPLWQTLRFETEQEYLEMIK